MVRLVKVAYYPYEWTYTLGNNARSGIKGILKGVQVLNLVEYIPKDDFEEETGFVSNTPTEAIEIPFE